MPGRWLLDAAALFAASRRVLSKHVALRNHQFDKYNKTSSLAKAIKSQTDRVTLTVRAATAIAKRFNETESQFSKPSHEHLTSNPTRPVTNKDSVDGNRLVSSQPEGLEQDHYYKRPEGSGIPGLVPGSSLDIHQQKPAVEPLPNGTMPSRNPHHAPPIKEHKIGLEARPAEFNKDHTSESPGRGSSLSATQARVLQRQSDAQVPSRAAEPPPAKCSKDEVERSELDVDLEKGVYYTTPSGSSLVLSSLPRVKVPKVTENIQESDEQFPDAEMNQDVYYNSKARKTSDSVPEAQALSAQEPGSESMYSEIFHSPRVAKLLSGGPRGTQKPPAMNLQGPNSAPIIDHKAPEEKGTDVFNSRTPTLQSVQPVDPEPAPNTIHPASKNEADISQPAADFVEDVQTGQAVEGEVRSTSSY
jgi:aarF domain-containing kinase